LRKFAHHQGFDIRLGGFLVVEVGTDVADMGIGQADDLAGIARIGENFLITG
jgi:hypothetical protein